MSRSLSGVLFAAALAAATGAAGLATPAAATSYSFGVTWFNIAGTYNGPGSGDPDFGTVPCCGAPYSDEVLAALGPDGLPVYNTASAAPVIHDVNGSGEITWWSPSLNSNVTQTGTGTVTTPYVNNAMFPPNGTGGNDAHGFLGAIISGTFNITTPEAITFTLGSDDDSFLYVDNTAIAQLGGIHGVADITPVSPTLSAGIHDFKLFYVDRQQTGAGLHFDIQTPGLDVNPPPANPVPEPASLALLASGLLGLGLVLRRRV